MSTKQPFFPSASGWAGGYAGPKTPVTGSYPVDPKSLFQIELKYKVYQARPRTYFGTFLFVGFVFFV